jgi:hypothetical protein
MPESIKCEFWKQRKTEFSVKRIQILMKENTFPFIKLEKNPNNEENHFIFEKDKK